MLLREAIGDSLRRERRAQHRTLREVSAAARVSLGYLSEIERGRKEPSSELLAAVCQALTVPLPRVLAAASLALAQADNPKTTVRRAATPTLAAASGGPRIVIPAPSRDSLVLVRSS